MIGKIKTFFSGRAKHILLILLCVVIAGILIWYNINNSQNVEETVINRGQVAKAVTLLFHSKDDISKVEDKYFNESKEWYVKYMNVMYENTYYTKNQVKPVEREVLKSFTYADLDNLFTNLGVVDKKMLAYINNNKSASVITMKEWNEIYKDLIKLCDYNENIEEKEVIIVGTISNVPTFKPWIAATDVGQCGFDGLTLDSCIDKKISVLMRDNEIITILDVVDENVTYNNAWIISINNGVITAFIEGARREFYIDDKDITYNNVTADIVLNNKKLKDYTVKGNFITGKVLALTDDEIEIEGYGRLSIDTNLKVYSLYGELVTKTRKDVLIGYDVQRFVITDNKITAIVIDRDIDDTNIRVLLKNTGYADIYHDEFSVYSEAGFTVKYGNKVDMYASGDTFKIDSSSELFNEGRITVIANNSSDKLVVDSITRNDTHPAYRGSIELQVENDKLIVINELSLEEYLYAVVPSEMPWSYSEEALKAQAVCARTYAYKHIINSGYSEYGAHVDDSTSYQVYNSSGEQDSTTKAVNDTAGIILTYEGQPISAYFFSTSCGSTTNSLIWGSDIGYLSGALLTDGDNTLDLTDEATFNTFIRTGYKTFDSEYPWYRWNVTMTMDDLTESINKNIQSIYESNNKVVKVQNENGDFINEKVVGVGTVKKIEEGTRNIGGVLDYITIYGTDKTIRVYREYNIRKLFDISGMTIKRTNGDDVKTMTMLPSAYVVFDENTADGLLSSYTIIGGGYGHGAGMSQNGANYMAKNGYEYEEILKFFFDNISFEKIKN